MHRATVHRAKSIICFSVGCRAARRVPQEQRARRRWTPFWPFAMGPRSPPPRSRRPSSLKKPARALQVLGRHHGPTCASSLRAQYCHRHSLRCELELELIQSHMAQKPVLRGEVGCACVAREVSVERRYGRARVCKALGWVVVGVKPIMACLCLWSQRPSLLWCSPQGSCNAPHDPGM